MTGRRVVVVLFVGTLAGAFGLARQQGAGAGEGQGGLPACEWCGAAEAPAELDWTVTIAGPDEPGERIILRGRVFETDGQTAAAGVLMYAYHTDATGVYRREGNETGNGQRHGVLRGWLRTDDEGRYEIRTTRPASYPNSDVSQHVHVTLQAPGREEHWVKDFLFADDPKLTRRERQESERAGRFAFVVTLTADDTGALVGARDIRLEK